MDADKFRAMIGGAARAAFEKIWSRHPDERFYVYWLTSTDDACDFLAAGNSEESLKRSQDRAGRRNSADDAVTMDRWNWDEWFGDYTHVTVPEFREINRYIEAHLYGDFGPDWYVRRIAMTFAAMIAALADLDSEGFFGSGDHRRKTALLCGVGDSPYHAFVEEASAATLNPSLAESGYEPVSLIRDWERDRYKDFQMHFANYLNEWKLMHAGSCRSG